jgi:hypothetical protein
MVNNYVYNFIQEPSKNANIFSFYLPHMEYEGSFGFVSRKNLMR